MALDRPCGMFDTELEALNFLLAWDHCSVYQLKQAIEMLRDCKDKQYSLVLPGAIRALQQSNSEPETFEQIRKARIIAIDRLGRLLTGNLSNLSVMDSRFDDSSLKQPGNHL
jgi:hypothetical protein